MSKFCALKSAGMGNRLKIYVSYLARYDEVMVEKEEDRYLFPDFKPCNREEDIKENPCYAVNRFLQEISDDLLVKKISNSQIFVKKTRSKD